MTGGPWHISDDPDDKWAISQDEIDDIESPLTLNAREFLELAVELGFPNDDDRYRRLVRAFGEESEPEDSDPEDGEFEDEDFEDEDLEDEEYWDSDFDALVNWVADHDETEGYGWSWRSDDEIVQLPTSYLADGGS